MLPNCHPVPGAPVRFVTSRSLSLDITKHGVDGYWDGGHYWSRDGADHWKPHEIKAWRYRSGTALPTTKE